jgi:hypothetical protein
MTSTTIAPMTATTVTARRHDGGEFIEIKFDDGL